MASSLTRRLVCQIARQPRFHTTTSWHNKEGKSILGDFKMADPLDHAEGLEKAEMLSILAGNDDAFDMKPMKRGPGTKEEPNLVGSYFNSRLVGCICQEDDCHVNWMWLHRDRPRRCECGYWFKLVDRKPPY